MADELVSVRCLEAGRFEGVCGLFLDVDGVLTDGTLYYMADGAEAKGFSVKDGAGLKYWHRAGHRSAIITGRESALVKRRASELGVSEVEMDAKIKLPRFESLLERMQLTAEQVVYVGDDLPDIPVMRAAGLAITVPDAPAEVKGIADAVTDVGGGRGAVREVIEAILQAQGLWESILARYFPAP